MGLKKQLPALILAAGFVLGTHGGYVALWQDGCKDPVRIYPVPVICLPSADRELLQNGLRAGTEAELSSLLEDFLS